MHVALFQTLQNLKEPLSRGSYYSSWYPVEQPFAENSQEEKKKHERPLGVCTFSRVFAAPCLKLGRTFHVFGDGGQKQSSAPPGDITVGNVGYGIYAKCGTFGKVIVFLVEL